MSKPENSFIAGVHAHLDKMIEPPYHEKMHNMYHGGTFDVWYSGKKIKIVGRDLWIEYKFLPTMPVTREVLPDLSELQKNWGANRHAEGRNVWVIVGCPKGGVIYTKPAEWLQPKSAVDFCAAVMSRKELANEIASFCRL